MRSLLVGERGCPGAAWQEYPAKWRQVKSTVDEPHVGAVVDRPP